MDAELDRRMKDAEDEQYEANAADWAEYCEWLDQMPQEGAYLIKQNIDMPTVEPTKEVA